jgi:hypothetical protein
VHSLCRKDYKGQLIHYGLCPERPVELAAQVRGRTWLKVGDMDYVTKEESIGDSKKHQFISLMIPASISYLGIGKVSDRGRAGVTVHAGGRHERGRIHAKLLCGT